MCGFLVSDAQIGRSDQFLGQNDHFWTKKLVFAPKQDFSGIIHLDILKIYLKLSSNMKN